MSEMIRLFVLGVFIGAIGMVVYKYEKDVHQRKLHRTALEATAAEAWHGGYKSAMCWVASRLGEKENPVWSECPGYISYHVWQTRRGKP